MGLKWKQNISHERTFTVFPQLDVKQDSYQIVYRVTVTHTVLLSDGHRDFAYIYKFTWSMWKIWLAHSTDVIYKNRRLTKKS